jgi:hypothetical protein
MSELRERIAKIIAEGMWEFEDSGEPSADQDIRAESLTFADRVIAELRPAMSEGQIIEQVARLIDPGAWGRPRVLDLCTFDGVPSSDWEQRIARESARRVVQGLGLHEEDVHGARRSMFAPEGWTRLVTDWQEDTK